ncbi:sensor histidine kinase [Hymenobacter lucidus]|uniref:Sensor histidine kinase n=1 Tax=Hymenobacter lucidus TaxID=2880930 RepID=A0ABS8AMT4_9BACT|nr:sensor histidine kinase [Hymenobacter lucidus]MCB2407096.1 sensor histidine kinase [Hymenobacter lucidus]
MNSLVERPSRSDIAVLLAYWLVAVPIILQTYVTQFGWPGSVRGILFTMVLDTLTVGLLVFGLLPRLLARPRWWKVLAVLVLFPLLSGSVYYGGYTAVFGLEANWSWQTVFFGAAQHAMSYGFLGIVLSGKRYFDMQKRLLQTSQAQTEMELRLLKAQIDPHFLFNNLNILHGLIQQDKEAASHYLSCFAALYRYLIRHKDDDFVTLAQELQFAHEYIYLLQQRFGDAYCFEQELLTTLPPDMLFVVPGTVQILLENAIKHNRGDEDDPLVVRLRVDNETLAVSNRILPKLTPPESTRTGLQNLRERYKILAGRPVVVRQDAEFCVTVPVVSSAR